MRCYAGNNRLYLCQYFTLKSICFNLWPAAPFTLLVVRGVHFQDERSKKVFPFSPLVTRPAELSQCKKRKKESTTFLGKKHDTRLCAHIFYSWFFKGITVRDHPKTRLTILLPTHIWFTFYKEFHYFYDLRSAVKLK